MAEDIKDQLETKVEEPEVKTEEVVETPEVKEEPKVEAKEQPVDKTGEREVSDATVKERTDAYDKAVDDAKKAKRAAAKKAKEEALPKKEPEKAPVTKDPYTELQKEFTKRSQENSELRKELEGIRAAVEKITKKPFDIKELAKDPEALQKVWQDRENEYNLKQIEIRAEARRLETTLECQNRLNNATDYPDWNKAQAIMQHLIQTKDPTFMSKFDWENGKINEVLDEVYNFVKPMISKVDWSKVPGFEPPKPAITEEDLKAKLEEAEKRGYDRALQDAKERSNGKGIASFGNSSARRQTELDPSSMSDADLEKLVKKGNPNYPGF